MLEDILLYNQQNTKLSFNYLKIYYYYYYDNNDNDDDDGDDDDFHACTGICKPM